MSADGPGGAARRWLERAGGSVGFHYATLIALQTKILWGIFEHRDLTVGDTASYFRNAEAFARELVCVIHWSPLYTSYFGSFLWFGDSLFAVTAHRVGIVVVVAWLVYEVARRLLPSGLAWLVAAWWIVLPTNHETLYEVHLFALAPLLATWLVLLRGDTPRIRAVALACLLGITVLVRNEYVLALGGFGLLALAHDVWADPRRLRAYVAPALVVLLLIGGAYARSTVKYPALARGLSEKHTLNVSQIYAFGYGQRHDDYEANPWIDYHDLMEKKFDSTSLTLGQAIAANPRAMAGHFAWNASLVPSGLQTALLGARGGKPRPGYASTPRKPLFAWLGTALVLAVWIVGGRQRLGPGRREFFAHLQSQRWTYTAMALVSVTVGIVALIQRPRPAYMFGLTVVLMIFTAHCLKGIAQRWPRLTPPAWGVAVGMIAVLMLAPSYWAGRDAPRPAADYYTALEAHRDLFPSAAVGVAVPGWENDLRAYLQRGVRLRIVTLASILDPEIASADEVARRLDVAHIGLVLVDEAHVHSPALLRFRDEAKRFGWETLERGPGWVLFQKPTITP